MSLIGALKAVGQRRARKYKNIYLPVRRSNEKLADDDSYINSALSQIDSLRQYLELNQTTRIIDFGYGQGRFANGLILKLPDLQHYTGVDTDASAIKWCKRWIERYHPNFQFHFIPAQNARYNPSSVPRQELTLKQKGFRLAFLNSVFSHMLIEDVKFYLGEMHKLLIPGGVIYATAFVEESVPEIEENPDGYLSEDCVGPLHRVRYEKTYLLNLFKKAGFDLIDFEYRGIKRTGQSIIVAGGKCIDPKTDTDIVS